MKAKSATANMSGESKVYPKAEVQMAPAAPSAGPAMATCPASYSVLQCFDAVTAAPIKGTNIMDSITDKLTIAHSY